MLPVGADVTEEHEAVVDMDLTRAADEELGSLIVGQHEPLSCPRAAH